MFIHFKDFMVLNLLNEEIENPINEGDLLEVVQSNDFMELIQLNHLNNEDLEQLHNLYLF